MLNTELNKLLDEFEKSQKLIHKQLIMQREQFIQQGEAIEALPNFNRSGSYKPLKIVYSKHRII